MYNANSYGVLRFSISFRFFMVGEKDDTIIG